MALTANTFLFAILLWRFVEKPFRPTPSVTTITAKPMKLMIASAVGAMLILPAMHVIQNNGWSWRMTDQQKRWLSQIQEPTRCNDTALETFTDRTCSFGSDDDETVDVALVGDSHALHWLPGLDPLFKERDIKAVIFSEGGELPFLGGNVNRNGHANESSFTDNVYDWIGAKVLKS